MTIHTHTHIQYTRAQSLCHAKKKKCIVVNATVQALDIATPIRAYDCACALLRMLTTVTGPRIPNAHRW